MVKTYIITSAQYEAQVNKQLMHNIDTYAKRHNAEVLILPMKGKSITEELLSDTLQEKYKIITSDYSLNKNLKISNYELRPQQINPLTGLKRFAQGDKSFIFASPKQVLEYIANSYDIIPKAIMTTGAITKPNYNKRVRTGRIAEKDHEYGFVTVTIQNHKYFHFRQVKALTNGDFFDIDGKYKNGKFESLSNVPALIVGDLHPYDTNKVHERNTLEQIKQLKPKNVFLHDTFNAKSISHHYKNHNIESFFVANTQGLNLGQELKHTAKAVQKYLNVLPKDSDLYIVASNHDEHLYRYLDEGRFVGDKGNDLLGAQLYVSALMGENPLEVGLSRYMNMPKNLHFIERNEGFKMLGYELGHHGDLGANGGRGSKRSLEEANGKSITGHTHSAMKMRNTYKVGTSTNLRLNYNRGYSNWTQTNAVLTPIGTVLLLNTIGKKWY